MTISAPSIDPHEGSRIAGADGEGRPASQDYGKWLTLFYWINNVLGVFAVVLLIVPAIFALALELYMAAGFYAVIAGHIIFSLNILRLYRKHYKAAALCCDVQDQAIFHLHTNLLKERDSRTTPFQQVRRGGAAAGFNAEQVKPAAVVVPLNPKGAA